MATVGKSWVDLFTETLNTPDVMKYMNAMQMKAVSMKGINVPALTMPLKMQLKLKLMSGPAKFFTFVTAAYILVQFFLRAWSYSNLKDRMTDNQRTWFWINTILAAVAAILVLFAFVVLINTLYFARKKFMAWVIALLPILSLLAIILVAPTIVEIVTEMVTGKDLAAALAGTFPNAYTKFNEWLDKKYLEKHPTPEQPIEQPVEPTPPAAI